MTERHYLSEAPTNEVAEPLGYRSRRGRRTQRRIELRAARRTGGIGWIGGVLLIGLGIAFLLVNMGILEPFANWWALFFLIPAAGALTAAVGLCRRHGNPAAALGPFLAGLFFLFLASAFLLGFEFELSWPLFLIAGGLLILLGPAVLRRDGSGD